MNHTRIWPERADPPGAGCQAPEGVELRHLRYFVAVADAGTFTHAAERMFIAQPTLSQQIRRLEELIGAPLLHRRRDGVGLTEAGAALLDAARRVLSRVDHGVSRTRQAAGLGRPRLRFVVAPSLPEALAVEVTSRLRRTAADADIDLVWLETALDADFSPIRQRRADAGLSWISAKSQALPAPLDVMSLGEFEPVAWVPFAHPAAGRGEIGLDELVRMDVIHGPRQVSPGTYDTWLAVLRTRNPHFDFTEPPFRRSLPMTLAFAATASPPAVVLTGPHHRLAAEPGLTRPGRPADTSSMVPVRLERHPLSATAGLAWNSDLPRQLQQVLFDTADGIAS
jgi:DNA-binding transcriptional LysR family regulator